MRPIHAATAAVLLAAVIGAPASAPALEKRLSRFDDEGQERWGRSAAATISYYNLCTAWTWIWTNWDAGDAMSVDFDLADSYSPVTHPCGFAGAPDPDGPSRFWMLLASTAPSGYGFTGTISVGNGPSSCNASPIVSQPFIPAATGWHAVDWSGFAVSGSFHVRIDWAAPEGIKNGTGVRSEAGAGPTGPSSCGTCYPSTRFTHSRVYAANGADCPSGSPISSGPCDFEFVTSVDLICYPQITVGVGSGLETRSWGRVKALYR